jgi:hypothetical protein
VHLKKIYPADRARREKNLSASAAPRDKKYVGQEFLIGSYSGENVVKSYLKSH